MTEHDYDSLGYNGMSKRLFAAWYDLLNAGVENRVIPYRRLTAGLANGKVLEIGGGTGANLEFYPPGADLTFVEPNPHMAVRLQRNAAKLGGNYCAWFWRELAIRRRLVRYRCHDAGTVHGFRCRERRI